ncbi:hypothetical protein AB0J14_04680 [Micromonospora arborensis]|uniref:hypothetical protein n=1 Tax=Micromonospora arborensis TaxID=2116518 RepID=UPI0034001A0B
MTFPSRILPTPDTSTAEHVAAVLDVVTELYRLLDARLPAPASAGGGGSGSGGPVKVTEPAPDKQPDKTATPVSEPDPDEQPTSEDDTDDEPVEVTEPAPDARPSLPPPPPRHGKGSGLDAWQAFANVAGVTYPADAGRNDIIQACVDAKVIDAAG